MLDKKTLEEKLKKATKKGLLDMWASESKEELIEDFSLVPAPEQIKSMIAPFPFRIDPRKRIKTVEEWKGYPEQKYLPVKKYEEEWFWFTQDLEPKNLNYYKNNEILIAIDSERFSLLDFVKFSPVFFMLTEDIQVYYKVKRIDSDNYMLDALCPHEGKCNKGGKCPGNKECTERRRPSPIYEPFLVHPHNVYPTLKDYEDIWKSVPKQELQKEVSQDGKNYIEETDYIVKQEDFKQETKDHYGKKQKEWVFTMAVDDVVCVTCKPSKELGYYDNIFTLPPLLSYSEAKKLDTRNVHFYSLTSQTIKKDIQGGYTKGKTLKRTARSEYLIPFTSKCSVKTLLEHWPIIQTFQAISVGREKGTKSKKEDDDITLFIEKPLARKKDPKRKGRMDRQRLLLSSLCPFAKETIEKAMYDDCQDYLTRLPDKVKNKGAWNMGNKYEVTKICQQKASCDKDCPLKTKGQKIFIKD